jgi:hypothetical protein
MAHEVLVRHSGRDWSKPAASAGRAFMVVSKLQMPNIVAFTSESSGRGVAAHYLMRSPSERREAA